ncbi:hypothetical protein SAMN02746041_00503 [Desulfacinum hydrothermale DSM 13146]|uniref:HEAT repeat-containing protein n=1 Tax=Desulfacinum hydrothermale DSM 13146 TaxID=1121390 RepID=A0A1W1X3W3_9BACT|nr:hypothetical protein [Desulfacinum hydrothermale]SMC18644.1 hypothetical protein SAMN02746041_00503 [Desulfacinum hydrothermale DSM 13146]
MEKSEKLAGLTLLDPWDWPEDTPELLVDALTDKSADRESRLMACEMAGDLVVMSDDMAERLLGVATDETDDEEVRGMAAVALGAALEYVDVEGFEEPEASPISEALFDKIQETLHRLYLDPKLPKLVRRRVLEASVRAPQDWHEEEVASAYASKDPDWRLTAVFCMRWVSGFHKQILEALRSDDDNLRYEALNAAGMWGLSEAAPVIEMILHRWKDKDLSVVAAAVDAAPFVMRDEAADLLQPIRDECGEAD